MTASTVNVRWPGRESLRALDWNHPEWWVVPLIGGAWLALAAAAVAPLMAATTAPARDYSALFLCPLPSPAGLTSNGTAGILAAAAGSAAMVVAMMAPLALPALHHAGLTGLWSRRRRGPAIVLAGFVATWLPALWLIDVTVGATADAAGPGLAVVALTGAAAAWHMTRSRARSRAACRRTAPIAPHGWRADVGCLRQGVLVGRACVPSCAGLMVVVAVAGHSIMVMALLSMVALVERSGRRPRRLPGLAASAAVGAVALIGSVGL